MKYCDMTPGSRNSEISSPLLFNGPVSTFPRQLIRKQQSCVFLVMQRRCKHVFLRKERLCFLRGPCKVVLKKSSVESGRVEFRDPNLPGYEFWSRVIEVSPVFEIGSCRIMARKELGGAKKVSCLSLSSNHLLIQSIFFMCHWLCVVAVSLLGNGFFLCGPFCDRNILINSLKRAHCTSPC
jgi:hypothetical protein